MKAMIFRFVVAGLLVLPLQNRADPINTEVLTNIASHYGLPLAPKNARLVLAHTESWQVLGTRSTSHDPAIYSPAFLLHENSDGSVLILRGTELSTLKRRGDEPLWRTFSADRIIPRNGGYAVSFENPSAFICALQLAMRGENSTAQAVWKRFDAEKRNWADDGHFGNLNEAANNQRLLLGICLFNHLRNDLLQYPSRWPAIQKQMAALLNDFPSLNKGRGAEVLAGLTAAVNFPPPRPDSTEALLLAWSKQPSYRNLFGFFREGENTEADAPARAVILRGTAAVPDLISLLNDNRISTHEFPDSTGSSATILRLGDLAGELLQEITGITAAKPWENPKSFPYRAWLQKSDKLGTEETLAESIFTWEHGKITRVNESSAHLLAQNFPGRLISLCSEFAEHATDEAQTFSLTRAIIAAPLPRAIQIKALTDLAEKGSFEQKRCVLQDLANFDQKTCADLLVPILERMPLNTTNTYSEHPEAAFTYVVSEIEDDVIWRKYLQVAKRSSVGLRMAMMAEIDNCCIGLKNRERRLAFLAAFLNDRTESSDCPSSAFTFKSIAVRNLAAMKAASILEFKEVPDEFWTFSQWSQLRKKVQMRLATEKVAFL
jgi:hypothetical protein